MNVSERNTLSVFEILGIDLRKIPESQGKTPDFEGDVNGTRLLVEVKEIRENPNERAELRKIENNDFVSKEEDLDGKRFQKVFSDANRQLKEYSDGNDFCIVVIQDVRHFFVRSESPLNELHQAMFGAYVTWVNVDNKSVHFDCHEKSRALNATKNTTISCAVMVFGGKYCPTVSAICIHNKFAKTRLPEGIFAQAGFKEYRSELVGQRETLVPINT
ncbi:hypothetical protein WOB69_24000 [Vibrio parahaemolyticus]|uniref:hypothetical protein n=1 Tax=Vibrio parahaemolyticus TaxID=670 RepID=UPI0023612891|nr:hypothetical protein [Vibrio parahaemolyticus]